MNTSDQKTPAESTSESTPAQDKSCTCKVVCYCGSTCECGATCECPTWDK